MAIFYRDRFFNTIGNLLSVLPFQKNSRQNPESTFQYIDPVPKIFFFNRHYSETLSVLLSVMAIVKNIPRPKIPSSFQGAWGRVG